jgi:hypothetical protein
VPSSASVLQPPSITRTKSLTEAQYLSEVIFTGIVRHYLRIGISVISRIEAPETDYL